MNNMRKIFVHTISVLTITLVVLLFPSDSLAQDSVGLPDGSNLALPQKCPVCGMMIGGASGPSVAVTYQDGQITGFSGVAAAVFKDGHVVGFEGARCLFIYNSLPQKFNIDVGDIKHQFVTDFVSKKLIVLSKAFLVLGSRIKGPMGFDLIAFISQEEAANFGLKYDGKWIVQLHEIPKHLKSQENGVGLEMNKNAPGDGETPDKANPRNNPPPTEKHSHSKH